MPSVQAYYMEQTEHIYTCNKLGAGEYWNFAIQIKNKKFLYLSHK